MEKALGHVFKYGDNVDTDVIIPARYLNSFDAQELASHAMVDIDPDFVKNVKKGDLIVANKNFGCGDRHDRRGRQQRIDPLHFDRQAKEYGLHQRPYNRRKLGHENV